MGNYVLNRYKLGGAFRATTTTYLRRLWAQPLDGPSRTALMELVEDRYGKSALIITSQVPVSKWYDIIGEQTIADAILDRIVHNAHRLELKGESLRKKRAPEFIPMK